jgi:prolipoprotein diacylglyceryltransferase
VHDKSVPIIPVLLWGSVWLSIGLSIIGLVRRSPRMVIAGAVLAGPLSFYLGLTPVFRIWAWFLPGLQVAAALALRRSLAVAVVLLLPFISIAIWLALVVYRQHAAAA